MGSGAPPHPTTDQRPAVPYLGGTPAQSSECATPSSTPSRLALGIQYNGASWLGWQSQSNRQTVQDQVEAALSRFATHPIKVHASGRTDTGVHALWQVAHCDVPVEREAFSWVRGSNRFLPPSIRLQWAQIAPPGFNARGSALSRSYLYVIYVATVANPFLQQRATWLFTPLDLHAMQTAANHILGQHDFSAFRSSQCQAPSPVKTMMNADISQQGNFFVFRFRANSFLQHQVRNLVGAFITIGQGKRPSTWMADVLQSRDRRRAAPTAAPDGLYLADIEYPASFNLPANPWAQCLPFVFPPC